MLFKMVSTYKQYCVINMQLFKQFSGKLEWSSWASPDLNRNPLIPKRCPLKLGDYLVTHLIKRLSRFMYQTVLGPKPGKPNSLAGKPAEWEEAQKYLKALFPLWATAPKLSLNPLSKINFQLKAGLTFLRQQTNSDSKHINWGRSSLRVLDVLEHLRISKLNLTELALSPQQSQV